MALTRHRYLGVWNIVRFNWHFYVLTGLGVVIAGLSLPWLPAPWSWAVIAIIILTLLTIIVSLLASHWVYDRSSLYELRWLSQISMPTPMNLLNIHAGFDETSAVLAARCPQAQLTIADFYDPTRHTEVSVQRARRVYPPEPTTVSVRTEQLPFADGHFHLTCVLLSAHEVRDAAERASFFKELSRVTHPQGRIVVTEHLRDAANFLAYTIGFFHFHSRAAWQRTFAEANLIIESELKTTPLISTFILRKNGTPS